MTNDTDNTGNDPIYLSAVVMAKMDQHAEKRKQKIARLYGNVVKGPGNGAPALLRARQGGVDLALITLTNNGLSGLAALIKNHTNDRVTFRNGIKTNKAVTIGNRPVTLGMFIQQEVELEELTLMMKYALREHNRELRRAATRKAAATMTTMASYDAFDRASPAEREPSKRTVDNMLLKFRQRTPTVTG